MDLKALKAEAARRSLAEVRDGMRLGLGTGSTVEHLLVALGEALGARRVADVVAVPTSERTAERAIELGIPLAALEDLKRLDLCIDGADEIDPRLDLIKGLGGALLREKMVARAAARFIVIADETKLVARLGEKSPLPIEVVPFAHQTHLRWLADLGFGPTLRREQSGEPYRTDNGNLIIDARAEGAIGDAATLERALNARAGVVDHGLFLAMCDLAFIARPGGVERMTRP